MRFKFFITLTIVLLLNMAASAFTKSGDGELDAALVTLNATARRDFGSFKTEIAVGYNVTESKVDYLYASLKMEPADIFMACALARIASVSVDKVVVVYKANKAKGWGYIAQQLGIKPGSKEFHALKGKANKHEEKIKIKVKGKKKK